MALVLKIDKGGIKQGNRKHKTVECDYFVVYDKGKNYLQLDTYGSKDRKILDKMSQSLRFSPEAIKQLKELLSREF